MLTPKRAQEIWEQRGIQQNMDGLLTPAEENHVRRVWEAMPGSCRWIDVFLLIMNDKEGGKGGILHAGSAFTVGENFPIAEFRGLSGIVRNHVSFGKYYVYLRMHDGRTWIQVLDQSFLVVTP